MAEVKDGAAAKTDDKPEGADLFIVDNSDENWKVQNYLRDDLGWEFETDDVEDLTFDYEPEELGLDAKTAVEIKDIKQLRPLVTNQPWGIFYINFEPKRLPVVVLRRVLRSLVIRKRASANRGHQAAWKLNDLLFISSYGESHIQFNRVGVMAMITNAVLLTSRSLRGVREHVLNTFNRLWELHLHGGTNEKFHGNKKDENVFEIEQMVAIHVYARSASVTEAETRFEEFIDSRENKQSKLLKLGLYSEEFQAFEPDGANCSLVPKGRNHEEDLMALDSVFRQFGAGVKTDRDSVVIGFDEETLIEKVREFDPDLYKSAADKRFIKAILYRPSDKRLIFYHPDVVASRSYPTMQHMIDTDNLGVVACGTWVSPTLFSVNVSDCLVEMKSGTHDRGTSFFPIYRRDELMGRVSTSANFSDEFISRWETATGTRFIGLGQGDMESTSGAEDALYWMYACFHSASYRAGHLSELSQGFPLVPLCGDKLLLKKLIACGANLVALHLLEDTHTAASWNVGSKSKAEDEEVRLTDANPLASDLVRFHDAGSKHVARGFLRYDDGKVRINAASYFEGVPEAVWNLHIGGYQVAHKWLKDRRERTLSPEDIRHYARTCNALAATIEHAGLIDKVIEARGGFG